jgi:hypothetical protein
MDKDTTNHLGRLLEEYNHTLGLLRSTRLNPMTRKVLEGLKAELERQIQAQERIQQSAEVTD